MEVELAIPSSEVRFPYIKPELQVSIRERGWTAPSAGAVLPTSTFRRKE
jgi:hypothetical protein